ncbi:PRTRC system protein E [Pseudomonas baetica]|uniref:PRTRC system protein E n=1 Tax=Pseudomonas baetica TaxID=674054 RepID=UPI002406D714|nr:PRTRC system protein E [Pseudomonas baetica]MDF9779153.1 PRTRC genetic system protein E [Pseudomonas baetica]
MKATFFQAVASVLTANTSATIEVQGLGEGQIKVIYTPNLGPTPHNASDDVVNLRAAICKPMVVAGTADEVEDAFCEHIKKKAVAVTRGLSMLDEIERIGAAALANANAKATAAPAPAPAGGDLDVEEEESDDDDNQVAGNAVAVTGYTAQTETKPKTLTDF